MSMTRAEKAMLLAWTLLAACGTEVNNPGDEDPRTKNPEEKRASQAPANNSAPLPEQASAKSPKSSNPAGPAAVGGAGSAATGSGPCTWVYSAPSPMDLAEATLNVTLRDAGGSRVSTSGAVSVLGPDGLAVSAVPFKAPLAGEYVVTLRLFGRPACVARLLLPVPGGPLAGTHEVQFSALP